MSLLIACCAAQSPAVCSLGLTGDYAVPPDGAADISGGVFTKATVGGWVASTNPFAQTTISSGRRVVECLAPVRAESNGGVFYALISLGGANPAIGCFYTGTDWTLTVMSTYPTSTVSVTRTFASNDVIALGVNGSTGAGIIYLNGSPVTDGGAFDVALAAIFSGKTAFTLVGNLSVTSGAVTGEFVSDISQYSYAYGGASDWCGNAPS